MRSLRRSSGQRKRFDRGKPVGEHFARVHKIVVSLETQPEFGFHPKEVSPAVKI